MSMDSRPSPAPAAAPRLWIGAVIVVIQIVAFVLSISPTIANGPRFFVMMLAPMGCALLYLIWILFASRLPRRQRFAIAGAAVGFGVLVGVVAHPSARIALLIYGAPIAITLTLFGLAIGARWAPGARQRFVTILLALGWLPFVFGRLDGFDGTYLPEWSLRFSATPEQAFADRETSPAGESESWIGRAAAPGDWTSFRGPARDGIADVDPPLAASWEGDEPRELWRTPIGPGWGAFALAQGRLFSLEQRGDDEALVAYDASNGQEVWQVRYAARFTELVSGPGPRSTPTYDNGRVYALGATGWFACVDAGNGTPLWQRDLAEEIGAVVPMWGCSASPLVIDDTVIVFADGSDERSLVAYDADTGEPRWHVSGPGMNYASAQPARLAGMDLVLFTTGDGLLGLDPSDGTVLFSYRPKGYKAAPMIQPQAIGESSVFVALGDGVGVARVDVRRDGDQWSFDERWSSRRLRPSFNDFVHHDGHLYGFSQHVFVCIDADTGARACAAGRRRRRRTRAG